MKLFYSPKIANSTLFIDIIAMITIGRTNFKSNIALADILTVKTKVDMLKICDKLDLYLSPNLKMNETARRIATEILCHPIYVLSQLCKPELQLLDKFVKAGANQYIVVKQRKAFYKSQKFALVLTYQDFENDEWHLLMPDCVRESLATSNRVYL